MSGQNGTTSLAPSQGSQLALTRDPAIAAAVARSTAEAQARWQLAQYAPRNMDAVRDGLLHECRRPSFAAVAIYSLPRGGQSIEGLSIRFVEAALQAMGNVDIRVDPLLEDSGQRQVQVTVADLERNISYQRTITLSKTMERKYLKKGETALGQRPNSYGDTVYLLPITEGELAIKEAAQVSRAIRTLGLRLIPGYLQAEAEDLIRGTLRAEDQKDPDSARRAMLDRFSELGVKPRDLEQWLGHDVGKIVPAELSQLRSLYTAIRDGQTTWVEAMDAKHGAPDDPEPPKPTSAAEAARAAVAKAKERQAQPARSTARPEASGSLPHPGEVATGERDPSERHLPHPGEAASQPPPRPAEPKKSSKPSRSKAAREERQLEVDNLRRAGFSVASREAIRKYVEHGDPRNLKKGLSAPEEEPPPPPKPPRDDFSIDQSKAVDADDGEDPPGFVYDDDGNKFDDSTGELLEAAAGGVVVSMSHQDAEPPDDELPPWMDTED